MNDKVRMAVTLLPVLLVPLFNERNRIKEHPDMQKLGSASATAYSTAKDKGTHAAHAVRNAGATTYNTSKSAVSTIGNAISDRRHETAYKKEMKSYQKSLKEEDSLLRQFEKEKTKHRKKRLSEKSEVKVPKIMQPHSQPDNDEKSDRMTVESEHVEATSTEPEVYAEKKSFPDNYGIAAVYYEDQSDTRASLDSTDEDRLDLDDEENFSDNNNTDKGMDNMTMSINPYIEEKVKGHPEENFESGDLFKKHKQKLDPRGTSYKQTRKIEREDSLFNRHRDMQEQKVTEHGRRTGLESAMSKSKYQKKLEKKINKHLDKHHS
ncbi:hypothetical protein [Salinicoccus halodurans]|uniref:Uncharacterized protein n=1 Tax=Salinicoccus halodurans TaxID=407035 RepID=A0A0F7HJE4_9STAP|nr:hypothetical protein [Salinicoccus halodurans]AKG73162.1 hypothetical protein AAT16_02375 [Salinicoccus halodurans]SFK84621.1 hypothetical protein SAMN05216235_2049 [Salinicoccus halodurans]